MRCVRATYFPKTPRKQVWDTPWKEENKFAPLTLMHYSVLYLLECVLPTYHVLPTRYTPKVVTINFNVLFRLIPTGMCVTYVHATYIHVTNSR